jgi:parallel beta-helix repeat protein
MDSQLIRALKLTTVTLLIVFGAFFALGAGSAVANHVQCGQTITQDTTLDSDLIDCSGYGIVIGADNITLKLGGHRIDGALTSSVGINNNAGYDNVQVKGGVVRGFSTGVELTEADNGSLWHVRLIGNRGLAILLSDSNENRIEKNSIFGNGGALYLSNSHNNRIRRNSAQDQGWLVVQVSNGNEFEGNTFSGSRYPGTQLEMFESHHNRFVDNIVSRPGGERDIALRL